MLVATPYVTLDKINKNCTPRIISEVRKREVCKPKEQIRPRISGELLVLTGMGGVWLPRRVMIRSGHLYLGGLQTETEFAIRIPLRQLSLHAGPLPNSLSLITGQTVILTFQTANERTFDLWVKTITIELIRQTPLDTIKYFDILSIAEDIYKRNKNQNAKQQRRVTNVLPNLEDCEPVIPLPECDLNQNYLKTNNNFSNTYVSTTVQVLLNKCQSSENYVSVKEKLVLFESLCKIGRVRSGQETFSKVNVGTKRARSMHDLSYDFPTGGVREICKYFESKRDNDNIVEGFCTKNQRLVQFDSKFDFKSNIIKV